MTGAARVTQSDQVQFFFWSIGPQGPTVIFYKLAYSLRPQASGPTLKKNGILAHSESLGLHRSRGHGGFSYSGASQIIILVIKVEKVFLGIQINPKLERLY